MRQALRVVLEDDERFAVAGEVGRTDALLEAVTRLRPDLVLLDLMLPGGDPIRLIPQLPATVVFSGHDDPSTVNRALTAGALGFIYKSVNGDELCEAIAAVVDGHPVLNGLKRKVVRQVQPVRPAQPRIDKTVLARLTPRQQRIFRYVVGGATSEQIAELEALSQRTIEGHRYTIRRKLDLGSRADWVRLAQDLDVDPLLV